MPTGTMHSRRPPYPWDARFNTQWAMLVPDEKGNMVARRSRTLDATAPASYSYDSSDPFKERAFEWQNLVYGLGQSIAPRTAPRRYSHAIRADLSINGQWIKGPNFEDHIELINADAGAVRQLITALHSSTVTVFALCDNGVYRRASDGTWIASLTAGTVPALPGGQKPQQGIRFKNRGAGTVVDALYVGTNTGNLWRYNGSAWSQAAGGTGPPDNQARYVELNGDELWVAGDYWITKVEEDPFDATKYAGRIYIGDQSSKITWMRQVNGSLYVFKETGVYTVNDAGLDVELFSTLRTRPNTANGKNATVWIDQMWIPYGDQTYRLDSSGNLAPDGMEQVLENITEVKGSWAAGAGHNTWFLYEVYNNSSGTSYLMKHGSWVDTDTGAEFVNSAHHGALALWEKVATTAQIIPDLHVSGNDRLYVGFADGTVEWCVLPRNAPNPAADGNCEFTSLDSYVYLPIHHSNFQADNKLYKGVSVYGAHLSTTEWVEVEYRTDLVNSFAEWTVLTNETTLSPKYTQIGQRIDFPNEPPVFGRAIQIRVKLIKDPDEASSPIYLTPAIDGIIIHEQVRPSLSLEYVFNVLAEDNMLRRDGIISRRSGQTTRTNILNLAAGTDTVPIMLPDGTVEEMSIIDYREIWKPWVIRSGLAWVLEVTATQVRTITPQIAITSGLTYDTLETYTLEELEDVI